MLKKNIYCYLLWRAYNDLSYEIAYGIFDTFKNAYFIKMFQF